MQPPGPLAAAWGPVSCNARIELLLMDGPQKQGVRVVRKLSPLAAATLQNGAAPTQNSPWSANPACGVHS